MNKPRLYEFRIEGQLSDHWSEWFEGMTIQPNPQQDETIMKGVLPDQAALLGVLTKIHSLNLKIISVNRFE